MIIEENELQFVANSFGKSALDSFIAEVICMSSVQKTQFLSEQSALKLSDRHAQFKILALTTFQNNPSMVQSHPKINTAGFFNYCDMYNVNVFVSFIHN